MSIITRINKAEKRIVDLYNKLKNLPSGGEGVQTISGDFVDNTDPLNPILNDPRPYKVYTALLTQSGTNAPVATVLENTFNVDFSFEYINIGLYTLSSPTNVFIANKTCFFVDVVRDLGAFSTSEVLVSYDLIIPNSIDIATINTSSGVYANANGVLNNTTIEIRVYN